EYLPTANKTLVRVQHGIPFLRAKVLRDTRRSSKPEYRARYPDARPFHATRNTGAGQDFTDLAAAVQLRLRVASRVANFDSEAPALTRMEHGANPWRPTNFNAPVAQPSERRASNA